jgi:translation elongation factor EF-Ts
MSSFNPSADEVRALRDQDGIGMMEAKRRLRRENLIQAIAEIRESPDDQNARFTRLLDVVEDLIRDPL